MKTLLMMRHAKSDWDADYGHDHDRPLNKRGRRAADAMGRWLALTGQLPDRVLCSTAVRARTTLERAMEAGDWDCGVDHDERVYGAGHRALIELIAGTSKRVDQLMVIGHEPGMTALFSTLIGSAHIRFPTAAAARIELRAERWRDVRSGCGSLTWFLPPRVLADLDLR